MEFSKVIAARHSVRSFKDRGVDREVIGDGSVFQEQPEFGFHGR